MLIIKNFGNMGGGGRWGEGRRTGGRSGWEDDKYKFKNCLQLHHFGINTLPILYIYPLIVSTCRLYTFNKNETSYMVFYYKVSHMLCSNVALSKKNPKNKKKTKDFYLPRNLKVLYLWEETEKYTLAVGI